MLVWLKCVALPVRCGERLLQCQSGAIEKGGWLNERNECVGSSAEPKRDESGPGAYVWLDRSVLTSRPLIQQQQSRRGIVSFNCQGLNGRRSLPVRVLAGFGRPHDEETAEVTHGSQIPLFPGERLIVNGRKSFTTSCLDVGYGIISPHPVRIPTMNGAAGEMGEVLHNQKLEEETAAFKIKKAPTGPCARLGGAHGRTTLIGCTECPAHSSFRDKNSISVL
ncbi:uncharacterized protein B0T15DRAFT_512291 [Chaetomium strumarium]|uniref:Uncharacterized protein n=1 Tax=Chaetomium strumarium TaxID=1170767 RepID=A0AAJ0GQ46_9PEZI|nr:hypothetical protein B0T15DRAFT_512291 [Chaetomium strumarium]